MHNSGGERVAGARCVPCYREDAVRAVPHEHAALTRPDEDAAAWRTVDVHLPRHVQHHHVALQHIADVERLAGHLPRVLHQPCTMLVLEGVRAGRSDRAAAHVHAGGRGSLEVLTRVQQSGAGLGRRCNPVAANSGTVWRDTYKLAPQAAHTRQPAAAAHEQPCSSVRAADATVRKFITDKYNKP